MARRLVSSWTVELAYQALGALRVVCERAGERALADRLGGICDRLYADFNDHLVPDGVVAGLAHFGPDGVEYLLHPRDRRTGVAYRLLPMTRGIISGLFTPEQATPARRADRATPAVPRRRTADGPADGLHGRHVTHLHPCGERRQLRARDRAPVRPRPPPVRRGDGGARPRPRPPSRASSPSAPSGSSATCPPRCRARPTPTSAAPMRRSWIAARRVAGSARIRSGRIGVKGGWRVYSSGPGIFLNQLVRNVLGLRTSFEDVVFDPVLPADADGLTFDVEHDGPPRPLPLPRDRRWTAAQRGARQRPSPARWPVRGQPLSNGRAARGQGHVRRRARPRRERGRHPRLRPATGSAPGTCGPRAARRPR